MLFRWLLVWYFGGKSIFWLVGFSCDKGSHLGSFCMMCPCRARSSSILASDSLVCIHSFLNLFGAPDLQTIALISTFSLSIRERNRKQSGFTPKLSMPTEIPKNFRKGSTFPELSLAKRKSRTKRKTKIETDPNPQTKIISKLHCFSLPFSSSYSLFFCYWHMRTPTLKRETSKASIKNRNQREGTNKISENIASEKS